MAFSGDVEELLADKALHKVLLAWQAKVANPDLKRYALAEKLEITASIDGERGDPAHEAAVYSALSRLLKKGEVLIKNVERGRFPDHTDYDKIGKSWDLPRALQRYARQASKPKPDQHVVEEDEPLLI